MIFFLPAALLIIIGYFIKYKKVTWLISGYNTASQEQKKKYDIEKLTRHVGNFLFILAVVFIVMALLSVFFSQYTDDITIYGFCCLALVIIGGIIYLNTGNRVKK